jgi:hypothetical protein
MRDNIFQGTGYSINDVPKGPVNNDWNYNNWYSSLLGPHFKWEKLSYSTMAGFCKASGLECNGYDDFPRLSNPGGGDFTLLPSSLNIDRGVPIPGINDGFLGDAPDLGAFEYPVDLPPAVVLSARADSNPTKAATVSFKVTFSNRVSGVGLNAPFDDFRLVSNIPGAAIMDITAASETTYIVRVNAGTGNGTIRLDIVDDDSITDAAGNPLGGIGAGNGDFTAGETYLINKSITKVKATIFTSQPAFDGWVLESGENTDAGGSLDKGASTFYVGDDQNNQQYRGILSFNTSSLPNNAVILLVQLKIMQQGIVGSDPFLTHGDLLAEIRNGTFNDKAILQANDFSAAPTPGSVLETFKELAPSWVGIELQDANLALVNKIGATQFRLSFRQDDNDDLEADIVKFYSGNSVSSSRPQLIVTYYIP